MFGHCFKFDQYFFGKQFPGRKRSQATRNDVKEIHSGSPKASTEDAAAKVFT